MSRRRNKVLLYNPKAVFHTMPLALLAVGSALDRTRYEVEIVDARTEPGAHARILASVDDAICLGMTVLTGAPIRDALALARAVRERRPDLPIVWGGWHPSLFQRETLCDEAVDVTVAGQGEATFAELVERLARGEALDGVAGAAFREAGEVRVNPPRPLQPMEDFAPPDFGLIDVDRYFELKGQRQLDYITSTGCHFRCAFCADPFVYGRRWQGLSPEHVGDRVGELYRRHRFEDLNLQDETFFTYKDRVAEIAEQFLVRGIGISWAATLRADQAMRLPEETFAKCVESGLRRVLIGVESGSPRMLEHIEKDVTLDQIFGAAELCARHGVAVVFSVIVGFPGETRDDLEQTLAVVKRLRAMSPRFETPIFYFKPYPGSRLTRESDFALPQELSGWADFDYVGGQAGPWVDAATHEYVERFKFYNRFAWGPETWRRWPLQRIARWRAERGAYGWPVEKALVDGLFRAPSLS